MAEKDKEAYSEMTVAELKKILKSKKLPISGSKKELIERLTDKNWKKKHEFKKMKKYELYTSLSSRIWEKYNLEIVFLSPIFVILLWFTYSVTVSEKGWSQFGWDDLVELLRMFGGLVLICLIFIVPMVIVAIGLDNVLDSFKQSKNGQSFTLIYIVSFLIPIAGIIIGAIYLTNKDKQIREAGIMSLIIGILSILFYWFVVTITIFYLFS